MNITESRMDKHAQLLRRESRAWLLRHYPRARIRTQVDGETVAHPRGRVRWADHVGMWGPGIGYVYWWGTRGRRTQYRTAVGAGYLRELGGDFSPVGNRADGIILFDPSKVAPDRLRWFMRGKGNGGNPRQASPTDTQEASGADG